MVELDYVVLDCISVNGNNGEGRCGAHQEGRQVPRVFCFADRGRAQEQLVAESHINSKVRVAFC